MAWKKVLDDEATPLQRRMAEVLAENNLTQSAWSKEAGLSQSLVGQIIRGDTKGRSGRSTFAALAAVVGVNTEWLAEGIGPKYASAVHSSRVETATRYSNLDHVIGYWSLKNPGRWSNAAIDSVRATANHEPEDLSADAWEERLDAIHRLLSGKISLPEGSDSPDPPRGKRAK